MQLTGLAWLCSFPQPFNCWKTWCWACCSSLVCVFPWQVTRVLLPSRNRQFRVILVSGPCRVTGLGHACHRSHFWVLHQLPLIQKNTILALIKAGYSWCTIQTPADLKSEDVTPGSANVPLAPGSLWKSLIRHVFSVFSGRNESVLGILTNFIHLH